MSFWYDKDNKCTYEEWVSRAGGLLKSLDIFLNMNKINVALEFGTGNSTRVLAKKCKKVITVDSNEYSIIVPVDEQKSFDKSLWGELKKEDNVEFICGDITKLEFRNFKQYKPDLIVIDPGSTAEDKYLYRVLYDRLKANGVLHHDPLLFIDNVSYCTTFIDHLSKVEGYIITMFDTDQAVARKALNDLEPMRA